MGTSNCPNCGAPVPPGSRFCNYCGSTIGTPGTSAPLPSSGFVSPPALNFSSPSPSPYGTPTPGYMPPQGPPPRSHHMVLIVVLVVIVVLVFSVVLISLLAPAPAQVNVTNILDYAPDGVCGLNTSGVYYDGFEVDAGSSESIALQMVNTNVTACTVQNVVTNTTGFSLSDVEVPLTIPGNATYVDLNLTIQCPNNSFDNVLNLVFS